MNYDSLTSGDESSPTTEDLHGDAAVRTSPLVEPGFGDRTRFPADDRAAEREYLAHVEAEAAALAVRSGKPVTARAAGPAPYSIQMAALESGRYRASVYRGGLRLWRATFGGEGEAWEQARGLVGDLLADEGPASAA